MLKEFLLSDELQLACITALAHLPCRRDVKAEASVKQRLCRNLFAVLGASEEISDEGS